jgi:uncharacterized SAM-binding protein YcdF (DUF218 family)
MSPKDLIEGTSSPCGVILWVTISGFVFRLFPRTRVLSSHLMMSGALLWLVLVFTPIADVMVGSLEADYRPLLTVDQHLEIRQIVVLGGYGEHYSGIPVTSTVSDETMCRMVEALRLYRKLPGAKLILSGGLSQGNRSSVATTMAAFLKELGVPAEDLVTEDHSTTTYENLLELRRFVNTKPFILVTTASDMRRAMAVAHRLAMNPIAAPACIRTLQNLPVSWRAWGDEIPDRLARPSLARLEYAQSAYHEYLGFLWYKLRGWV